MRQLSLPVSVTHPGRNAFYGCRGLEILYAPGVDVVDIQHANNLIVIHTLAGSAHVAAEAIDSLKWPEILGTIAGDNTILVIVTSNDEVDTILRRFRTIIK